MTQPSEFLPKDRDGAVLFIKQELYDLLQELEAVLARNVEAHAYPLEHLHNLLDIIERS